jgi:hypothetical protein
MGKIGKYLYGVINSNANFCLSIPKGLLLGESESNEVVYTIPYQDISALVRDSEIVDYAHMRKDILARLLVGHQTAIERIMTPQASIIPVKLGTFAQDETEVIDILNKGYNLIEQIFEKIGDKIEIDVVCTWSDFTSVIMEAGEDKEIKELKEKLLMNPQGVTLDDRMKVGVLLKKRLDQMSQSYALKIQDALKAVSEDIRQHELMDDQMVINGAFLVCKTRQKEFYEQIEKLNNTFAEKLNFRCIGPLPPYSFYTLEIKKMEFSEVDRSRKKLGILSDAVSKDEIKKAYHRQAFAFHPDKNPDKPGIEKEFDQIKRSYDILLDFAQVCEQAGRENLDFSESEFKEDALLVRLKK